MAPFINLAALLALWVGLMLLFVGVMLMTTASSPWQVRRPSLVVVSGVILAALSVAVVMVVSG